ncbi:MAG: hypothetical protein R2939_12670 [Kofleriaceae bacterium]
MIALFYVLQRYLSMHVRRGGEGMTRGPALTPLALADLPLSAEPMRRLLDRRWW